VKGELLYDVKIVLTPRLRLLLNTINELFPGDENRFSCREAAGRNRVEYVGRPVFYWSYIIAMVGKAASQDATIKPPGMVMDSPTLCIILAHWPYMKPA
jgi:hypothetical protein